MLARRHQGDWRGPQGRRGDNRAGRDEGPGLASADAAQPAGDRRRRSAGRRRRRRTLAGRISPTGPRIASARPARFSRQRFLIIMAKLTKAQRKAHAEAEAILTKDKITDDERDFVFRSTGMRGRPMRTARPARFSRPSTWLATSRSTGQGGASSTFARELACCPTSSTGAASGGRASLS